MASKLKQSSMRSFLHQEEPAPSPSDYEKLRQETIRRNQDFLQKLGLPIPTPFSTPKPKPKPKPPAKRNPKTPPTPSVPLRRSSRKRGLPPPSPPSTSDDDTDCADRKPDEKPSQIEFVDSSVFKYACDATPSPDVKNPSSSEISASHSPVLKYVFVGKAFRDPLLSKIYSIDVRFLGDGRSLVAAGGHGGFISVYGGGGDLEAEEMIEDEVDDEMPERGVEGPLMSWKGSRGWNSGVMFLEGNPMLLASSSNDGAVVVWDVKKQPEAMLSGWSPPVVAELVGLHSSGIFAMDQFNGLIATASKDSSVGISRVTAAGEVLMERSVSGHHSGPIRGICFGGEKDRLADCGADGRICVLDTRLPGPCALTMESQHYRGVNTIEWCSTNKSLLLSAGKDPVLLLYDIRNPTEPVHKLRGHVSSSTATLSHIYRPSFVGGKMVATPGQGSKKISLYSIDKGSLVSQGWIGYDANLVRFKMDGSKPKLWTAGKQINQLSPLVKLSLENE